MGPERRQNDDLILQGLKEINEKVDDQSTKITTIETVLIGVKDAPGLTGIIKEHGEQIKKLTSWRFQVLGGAVVIIAIGGFIIKYML